MKTSLKNSLLYYIKSSGEALLNELYDIFSGYKQATIDRRLRELAEDNPDHIPVIEPIQPDDKNYIIGYRFIY